MSELIYIEDNRIFLECDIQDRDLAGTIPGRRWYPSRQVNSYPKTPKIAERLSELFPKATVCLEVKELLQCSSKNPRTRGF